LGEEASDAGGKFGNGLPFGKDTFGQLQTADGDTHRPAVIKALDTSAPYSFPCGGEPAGNCTDSNRIQGQP
jgi:hypothetical protein